MAVVALVDLICSRSPERERKREREREAGRERLELQKAWTIFTLCPTPRPVFFLSLFLSEDHVFVSPMMRSLE